MANPPRYKTPGTPQGIKGLRGRPFNTTTNLGKIMAEKGTRVYIVAGQCNVSVRQMTTYLNDQSCIIQPHHLAYLSRYLGCDPEFLQADRLDYEPESETPGS